jgi:hypothetical protein
MFIFRILLGLGIAAIGVWMVLKTESILRNFGANRWAEEHLSSDGGSRIFYKGIGVILIIIGFAIATDIMQPLLFGLLSPIFGGLR